MFAKLNKILSKIDADYADVRYEKNTQTSITFNGYDLSNIGSNQTDGFVIRALKNGGMASIAFTKLTDADHAIKTVLENASLISKHIKKPIKLSKTEIVEDCYRPELIDDPRDIAIEEKLELTQKYNAIPLQNKQVATTATGYGETVREKYFINSEGSKINEDLITTRIGGMITAKDGNILQNVRVSVGGSNGFANLRNAENKFEDKTAIAVDLLKADPVIGGVYNVILNPSLAGVFTHEAFGHFSEADLIEDSPSMRAKMQLNAQLGNSVLNIKDDPTIKGELGFYKYDDEGVRARPVQLMKNGILTGRLHSRRTANEFSEPLTGHCVAEDYRFAPIIRMGTIFIEQGTNSFEELLQKVDNGLYLLDSKGGQTSGENFTFGAQYGYIVKNGVIQNMVKDINISGNLYDTLQNIIAIGDKVVLSKTGGCGKGQINIRSCNGAPPIVANNVVVGGV